MSEIKTNKLSSLTGTNNDITIDPDGTGDTIIASGNVGVGNTSPSQKLTVEGTANNQNSEIKITASGVASGYLGSNSNGLNIGTDSHNIVFKTAVTGGGSVGATGSEKVRITTAGDVGIGRSDPQNIVGNSGGGLVVKNDASRAATTTAIAFQDSSGNNMFSQLHNGQAIFSTGAVGSKAERMRINSAGEINVAGKSSNANNIGNTYFHIQNANRGHDLRFAKSESGSFDALVFYHSGSAVGYISYGNSSTSYNTSSDYRLKENVTDITGATDRLKQLNPVRFNFIADADTTVDGFLAHEVADIVPEAISGTKDAMRDEEYEVTPAVLDDDGNEVTPAVMGTRSVPDYQGIDQSKLVPLLVAALQEQQTAIEALTARVTALEAE